jgi:transcriptional regulator with XRE-family HTH domain
MPSPLRIFSDLGRALRLLRAEVAELTQVAVAARIEISQGRLSRYETGRKLPDLATLDRILTCYGVDLEGLGRALKQVQDKPTPKPPESDPKFKAVVLEVLAELGYLKPETPQ